MSIADKLTAIAENVQKVYDAGKAAGGGGDSWYDTFWDNLTQNGTRVDYYYAFGNKAWNDEIFKPNRVITPTNASYMFLGAEVTSTPYVLNCLDFRQCGNFQQAFCYCRGLTEMGVVDLSNLKNNSGGMRSGFYDCANLRKVKKFVLPTAVMFSQTDNSPFTRCPSLTDITFEGTMLQSFTLGDSPLLSKASCVSAVSCLSDSTSGLTLTLAKIAVDNAFETAEGAADGSASDEWIALIATKPNWTISLV